MAKITVIKEKDNQTRLIVDKASNVDMTNAIIAIANYMVEDNVEATGVDVLEQIWAKMVVDNNE